MMSESRPHPETRSVPDPAPADGAADEALAPDLLWQAVAGMGHALGTSSRLHLLAILGLGARTVSELAEISGQAVPAASAQLQVLRRAGLVVGERDGRAMRYRLASPEVARLLGTLRETAEALMPSVRQVVDDVLRDPETLSAMSADELDAEMSAGRVVLVDVRTEAEFVAGHLPGAVNLPSAELLERLDDVQAMVRRGQRIVAYCRGPYCVTAVNAVDGLRRHGLAADRLAFGTEGWRASGRPLAQPRGGASETPMESTA
jgi:ArsR family transcriptional regulator